MILIVVKQPVRAKYADDWPSLVEEFTTSTRAEPGNISFDWYRSAEDPNLWLWSRSSVTPRRGRPMSRRSTSRRRCRRCPVCWPPRRRSSTWRCRATAGPR